MVQMLASLEQIVAVLNAQQVEFILIGGLAAAIHGSTRSTVDVDVVYRRTDDNVQRLGRSALGVRCRCVTLERLIQLKRAAGRPKDLEAIAELQLILEARRDSPPNGQDTSP